MRSLLLPLMLKPSKNQQGLRYQHKRGSYTYFLSRFKKKIMDIYVSLILKQKLTRNPNRKSETYKKTA